MFKRPDSEISWLNMSWKVTYVLLVMVFVHQLPVMLTSMASVGRGMTTDHSGFTTVTAEFQTPEGHEFVQFCVPNFQCLCSWNTEDRNSTIYVQVMCDATNVELDALMNEIPLTKRILLTCSAIASHNITTKTLSKHATSLMHLQFLYCSVEIATYAFSTSTSLQMIDIFYTSLTQRNLLSFGEINKNADEIIINLPSNHVTALPEFAFGMDHDKNITSLSLSFNKMETVSPRAFAGMSHLQKLYLNNNDITIVRNATFEGCNALQILHLHHNTIKCIQAGALVPLKCLRVLNMQWNHLEFLDVDSFSGMVQLRYLNLSHNSITSLPDGIFDGLTSLKELRLDWNSIISLQPMTLGPPWIQLTLFNISHNSLSDVTPFLLQTKMANIVSVDFSYNNLQVVRRGAVTGLAVLEKVDFRNNSLSLLEWEAVADTSKLLTADFRFNNFSLVPDSFINRFIVEINRESPISMLMAGNPISCGCSWALTVRTHYKDFYPVILSDIDEYMCETPSPVKGQHFIQLKSDDFWCPIDSCIIPGCDCYSHTANNAPIVTCLQKEVVSNLSQLPVTMVIFECFECFVSGISVIPTDSFSGFFDLQTLKLSGNNLTSIDPGTFSDLSNLRTLVLENNQLITICSSEITSLTSLVEADFHGNRLSRIDFNMFASSQNLLNVDLSENDLATLPDGLFNFTDDLQSVRLHGNPLVCNCSLLWLKHWMQEHFRIVEQINDVQCVTNRNDVWVPVVDVPDEKFGCRNGSDVITNIVVKQDRVLTIVMCCLVIVFFILTLVAVRYRYPIKVLLYTRLGLYFVHNDVESDDNFLYDAYLAYSDANIKEAIQEVVPRLEGRAPPYILCLRHRDFPIGDSIGATIVESINTSKRTILFLSSDFLENEWCMFEFQAAHAQSVRDKTNRIVIVVLDDIQRDMLGEDLKLYMSTNRCLKMTNPLFWDKLYYAMPKTKGQQRTNPGQLLACEELYLTEGHL